MKFLYPEFLWALTILAIPVIIHLFNFKRYKTLYFSSLSFIKHVEEETKSTQKLKQLLILLSRLLAFTFLILAFAQPYFPSGEASKSTKENLLVFYVDNSFSMQAHGPEGELLSQARENLRSIVESSPLNTRFIIGTNDMSGIEERMLNRAEAFEKIDNIDYSPLVKSIDEIIHWQQEVIKKHAIGSNESIQYVLLSDFQKSSGFAGKQSDKSSIAYFPIQLTPNQTDNILIDSIWFTSPIHRSGVSKELNIQLNNYSEKEVKNAEIIIDIDEFHKSIYVDIPKRQESVVKVSYTDKSEGFKTGQIKVVDKHLLFDDAFYISYEVRKKLDVLLLTGEDAVPNISLVYSLDDFFNSMEKPLSAVTKNDFNNKDLVIINGSNSLSKGFQQYLTDFHSVGGTVALFPGKQPNRAEWNALLGSLQLSKMGNTIQSGNRIKTINYIDPFWNGVFEKETKNLNLPSVSTIFQPISQSNTKAYNLLELQNGLPLLTSASGGGAFMFYSSLHADFGNFSSDALFSTLLLRIGELSQRSQPPFIVIGNNSRFPVFTQTTEKEPIRVVGDHIEFIPQTENISGTAYISIQKLQDFGQLTSGNYAIKSDKKLGNLSINYSRKESDLSAYTEEEIISHLKATGATDITFNEIGSGGELSTIDIDKPFSYWKFCIVLTIIFVAIEMLLIRFLK